MNLHSISYYLTKQIIRNDYFRKGDLIAISVFGGEYLNEAMVLNMII